MNQAVTDEELNKMFSSGTWPAEIDKRAQLVKSARNKCYRYWVGHTASNIMVDYGLINGDKPCGWVDLTERGVEFLKQELGVDELPPSRGANRHD